MGRPFTPSFCTNRLNESFNVGSEAVEAALKLARQYFLELPTPQPQRTRFIARLPSYHGTTLGALAVGGHVIRREPFEPLLAKNTSHVSPCYAYRGKKDGESDADYVVRLAEELDTEFQRVGPETVCAFIAEPVVGAVRFLIDSPAISTLAHQTMKHRLSAAFQLFLDISPP